MCVCGGGGGIALIILLAVIVNIIVDVCVTKRYWNVNPIQAGDVGQVFVICKMKDWTIQSVT